MVSATAFSSGLSSGFWGGLHIVRKGIQPQDERDLVRRCLAVGERARLGRPDWEVQVH